VGVNAGRGRGNDIPPDVIERGPIHCGRLGDCGRDDWGHQRIDAGCEVAPGDGWIDPTVGCPGLGPCERAAADERLPRLGSAYSEYVEQFVAGNGLEVRARADSVTEVPSRATVVVEPHVANIGLE